MPFYTNKCTICGHVFEDMRSISAPNPPCPAVVAQTEGLPQDGTTQCEGPTVRIPSPVSRPLGGPTPIYYRNRRENG